MPSEEKASEVLFKCDIKDGFITINIETGELHDIELRFAFVPSYIMDPSVEAVGESVPEKATTLPPEQVQALIKELTLAKQKSKAYEEARATYIQVGQPNDERNQELDKLLDELRDQVINLLMVLMPSGEGTLYEPELSTLSQANIVFSDASDETVPQEKQIFNPNFYFQGMRYAKQKHGVEIGSNSYLLVLNERGELSYGGRSGFKYQPQP